jgi:hypothetical protein
VALKNVTAKITLIRPSYLVWDTPQRQYTRVQAYSMLPLKMLRECCPLSTGLKQLASSALGACRDRAAVSSHSAALFFLGVAGPPSVMIGCMSC